MGEMKGAPVSKPPPPPAWTGNFWVLLLTGIVCVAWTLLNTLPPLSVSPQRTHGLSTSARRLFSDHAINNTIVIVPVNTGMLHLSSNLLCSLTQTPFNTSAIIFWALDASAQTILQSKGHAAYHDATLFSVSGNENARGTTKSYKRMMKDRPKFFIDVLSSGFDILMLDADTVFFQSPLSIMPSSPEDYRGVDIVYSTDARAFYQDHNAFQDPRRRGSRMPPICNGIFWMKSTPRTIALWTEMLELFRMPWPWGPIRRARAQDDQRAMDVFLNDGRARIVEPLPKGITRDMLPRVQTAQALNVRLLDQTSVANGHLLREHRGVYERNLASLRGRGQERLAVHFNWDSRDASKEDGARALEMYFLDEQGECRLDS